MADSTQTAAAEAAPDSILDQIFEEGRLVRDANQADMARNMLQGFLEEAAKAGTRVDGGAKRLIAERLVALDRLITAQVNHVLHHEKFQKLEASWRNLDKLVSENELSSSLRVRVFNCNRRELERDFARAAGFDQSLFFKHVYESEYGTLGGLPYSFLIGDMEFGRSPRDIQFLRSMASVAAMAHAPFIASADPRLFDLDSFTELDRPIDIAKLFTTSEMAAWNSLRDSPDSRYLVADRAPHAGAPALGGGFRARGGDGLRGGRDRRRSLEVPLGPVVVGPRRADHEILRRIRLVVGHSGHGNGRQGGRPAPAYVPFADRHEGQQVPDGDHHHRPARKGTCPTRASSRCATRATRTMPSCSRVPPSIGR